MERETMIRNINLFLICLTVGIFAQNMATITIESTPSDCWVRIDSVLVGKTPITHLEIPPGDHTVQVYPNQNGIWNLEEKIYQISLAPNEEKTLNVKFSRPIFINTIPFGAALYQDSVKLGYTPLYIPYERNRSKTFTLKMDGYQPYTFRLDSMKSLLVKLKPVSLTQEEKTKPQLLGFIPKSRLKSKFTLLALTVATHWASFYFKNQADENFDRYSRTADPALMDKYWKQTRKYDRLSAITLGVSYVSLAGLIYMVIWK
ncbi:MAG: PEGA domain-containing protein [Calditrichaeota bacterium]|nr:MAG: PEGA domain-containing protein [Calditrichota bacterium]